MIIFTILGIVAAVFFLIVIIISVIEVRIKKRKKEKLFYKMDKVETRTGGLAHDRNRTYSEIQKGNEKK
tara:strand:- start:641 stop:847 length:207 start_codon:yes stop_codon:yes gene_type:complete